jgi:His-Xaa-Ser system protein HxsD
MERSLWPDIRRTRLMRLMHLTRPMLPAATNASTSTVSVTVDFDSSVQTLGALEAAAYRLIGTATCQIEREADRFVCLLTSKSASRTPLTSVELRERFLEIVSDENLRLRVAERTEGVRNVILALAFGSLASSQGS